MDTDWNWDWPGVHAAAGQTSIWRLAAGPHGGCGLYAYANYRSFWEVRNMIPT